MRAEFVPILQMSLEDKLQLLEELWDDVASIPAQVPVPDWHKEELDRREAEYCQRPDSACSWEEAKERICKRNG